MVSVAASAAVAVSVFAVSHAGGAFSGHTRLVIGVAVWWAIACAAGGGLASLRSLSRPSRAVAALLVAFSLWSLASASWAPAEGAYEAFGRALLFTGVFLAAAVCARNNSTIVAGLGIGIASVAVLALATRLLPDVVSRRSFALEPGWETRLSYPLRYWNGLAILSALALPLLAGTAARRGAPVALRSLTFAVTPAIGAVIYLTSSRGGIATAGVGLLVFFVCTAGYWPALAATFIAAGGAVAGALALAPQHALVNGPLDSSAAVAQGHRAAVVVSLLCVVAATIGPVSVWVAARVRSHRRIAVSVVALILLTGLIAVLGAHPVSRFETFKATPDLRPGTPAEHILSAGGSGRWQFWAAAVDQFEHHPIVGDGAGTYPAWWDEHRTVALITHDAHSLYLQTLGELGVVGFLLLAGAFAVGAVVGVRRLTATNAAARVMPAAVVAAYLAYLVGLGIDWMWSMTIVSLVGMTLLGLLTGAAQLRRRPSLRRHDPVSRGRRAATAAFAVVAAGALLLPLLVDLRLRESQRSAASGSYSQAVRAAIAARDLEPWASSPFLQLALVAESAGDLPSAERWIGAAIDRDRTDWRLWYVATRIETGLGKIHRARRDLAEVRRLNPRSSAAAGQ